MLGTYNIPTDLDPATRLTLEEIGKLGVKLVNKEDSKIIITTDKFRTFWRRVREFTSSSMSEIYYRHYKAAI